jgi:Spy/CpxP family protein refolding chaperone
MKRILGLTLMAALMAAPAPAFAQQQPTTPRVEGEAHRHGPAQRPAFGFLFQHRAELGLTDQQMARLQQIAQRLEQQNQPLLQQLRDAGIPVRPERRDGVRDMTTEQRSELRTKLEAHRPTLVQLRQNTDQAMQEARTVLTPEQQERMRELMRQRAAEMRQRQAGESGAMRPRGQQPRSPRSN